MGTTVMATNIDDRVSPRILYDIFIQAGPVVDLRCPRYRETNKLKGFAFVEYETEEIASYAVKLFSGLVVIHRRTMKFSIAAAQGMNSQNVSNLRTPESCSIVRPSPGSTTPVADDGISGYSINQSPMSGSFSDYRIDYSYYYQERERSGGGTDHSSWNGRKHDQDGYPRKRTPY